MFASDKKANKWLKENKCSNKCKGYKKSVNCLNAVDINKVKNYTTISDIQLQKKLKKYLPIAERIDNVLKEEEFALAEEKKMKLIKQKLEELEGLKEKNDSLDIKSNYRNINSLI